MSQFKELSKTIVQTSFLRNILLLGLLLALCFPLFERLFSYPHFNRLLITFIENDAALLAHHISTEFMSDKQHYLIIPDDFANKAIQVKQDFKLEKIKVFNASGLIIFSTSPKDVGEINQHPYFHKQVASGHTFTKVVRKNSKSLEGRILSRDVVETYQPIMRSGTFNGAFELYYDITDRRQALNTLLNRLTLELSVLTFLALLIGLALIFRAAAIIINRDRIRQALEENEERLKLGSSVILHTKQGILIADKNNQIEMVNPAFTEITGYSSEEVVGRNPSLLKSGRHDKTFYQDIWQTLIRDGYWEGEIWNRRKDGAIYPEWLNISIIHDHQKQISHYVGVFSDISMRKENEERLEKMAFHDPLTTLPNRLMFKERLCQELKTLERLPTQKIGLLFLDLDHFKEVNDNYGHEIGDLLLQAVANKLRGLVRKGDTVARLGGDEFTILLIHLREDTTAIHIAEKIIKELSIPMRINGATCQIGTSIGLTFSSEHNSDPAKLIKQADQAMYDAKNSGRNRFCLYSPE